MNLLKMVLLLWAAPVTGTTAQTKFTRTTEPAGAGGAAAVTVRQYVFAVLAAGRHHCSR
jgi:hypothetical protein